jgi:hypothetical protein
MFSVVVLDLVALEKVVVLRHVIVLLHIELLIVLHLFVIILIYLLLIIEGGLVLHLVIVQIYSLLLLLFFHLLSFLEQRSHNLLSLDVLVEQMETITHFLDLIDLSKQQLIK